MASASQVPSRILRAPAIQSWPRCRALRNLNTHLRSTRHTSHLFPSSISQQQSSLEAIQSSRWRELPSTSRSAADNIQQRLLRRKERYPSSSSLHRITKTNSAVSAPQCFHQIRCYSSKHRETQDLPDPPPSPLKPTTILRRLPHENIYTLPNFLTFTRLLAAPAVGYFILTSQPLYALGLFFYAGVTDAVDGYLARRFNSQTVVGTVIDPMADKTLMTVVVMSLAVQGSIPVWLAVVILGRDVGLAISAIYFRWISLPPPKTMARYWDFSLPSAEVHPTEISKINTLLQLLLVGNAMMLPVLPVPLVDAWNLQGVFEGWQILVATTTIWSGLSYVWNKDAVKILTKEEINKKLEEMGLPGTENKLREGEERKQK